MTDSTEPAPPLSEPFLNGVWRENPTFVQVLGMCPTLAVSNSARNALAMGLATAFVLAASNVVVSSLRRYIPNQVRITTYILVIASFVTIVDYVIQAISLDLHKALGAFISLIVVNCFILGRAEAFASKNPILPSLSDGLGNGAGFCWALLCIGVVREVVGSGTLFGVPLFHEGFQGATMMLLPSGGFFTLAGWMLVLNAYKRRHARRTQPSTLAATGVR
jgi:electron transport complex protein RnfE